MTCYFGDVRDGLRSFVADGIRAQTCVTSPPYWGLRDYGVSGQIGLEPTIGGYVQTMVDVFRLVRDVLADDGTLWLNLGDSYTSGGRATRDPGQSELHPAQPKGTARAETPEGLKPKDLCGIPWRVAFALQADGWFLRQDIIWAKPNPMPESVTDRCTKAHEYLFLLSKRERYYFDAAAIAEPAEMKPQRRLTETSIGRGVPGRSEHSGRILTMDQPGRQYETRNRRSVWTITTESYSEAHFATFPTALVEPCIAAGSIVGNVVLDPFMGSGTVAQVAQNLGRRWIGCELNPDYIKLQGKRAAQQGLALPA